MPALRLRPACALPLLVLLAVACSHPAPAPDAAARAASHAGRGDRLLDTMQKLNAVVARREAAAAGSDARRNRYLQDLMDAAGEVVLAARSLSRQGPSRYLAPRQRNRFYVLADRLYVQAANVEYQAQESDFRDMRGAYERLDATCKACHRLFRDGERERYNPGRHRPGATNR